LCSASNSPWIRGAPQGGFSPDHPKDDIPHFLRNPASADDPADFGDATPIKRKSRPVSAHDGHWIHNKESLFPFGSESSHQHPEALIVRCQSRPWMSSLQCHELLTKGYVFKKEPATSTEDPRNAPARNPMAPIMRRWYRTLCVDGNVVCR
jgi:hypothetical protein